MDTMITLYEGCNDIRMCGLGKLKEGGEMHLDIFGASATFSA